MSRNTEGLYSISHFFKLLASQQVCHCQHYFPQFNLKRNCISQLLQEKSFLLPTHSGFLPFAFHCNHPVDLMKSQSVTPSPNTDRSFSGVPTRWAPSSRMSMSFSSGFDIGIFPFSVYRITAESDFGRR